MPSETLKESGSTTGLWANVVCKDGTIFEGIVQTELNHGIYVTIGGNPGRLNMFPWSNVARVTYKTIGHEL